MTNPAAVYAAVIGAVLVLVALGSVLACLLIDHKLDRWAAEDAVDAHAETAMAALTPDALPDFTADEFRCWLALEAPERLTTEEN